MHPNSLKNLVPWQPGTSPNPNGRPRDASLINYVLRNSEGGHELAEILLTIARNPKAKGSDRIAAVSLLMDRCYGRIAPRDHAALDDADTPAQRVTFSIVLGPDRGVEEIETVRTDATHSEIEALDSDTAPVDGDERR